MCYFIYLNQKKELDLTIDDDDSLKVEGATPPKKPARVANRRSVSVTVSKKDTNHKQIMIIFSFPFVFYSYIDYKHDGKSRT